MKNLPKIKKKNFSGRKNPKEINSQENNSQEKSSQEKNPHEKFPWKIPRGGKSLEKKIATRPY